MPTFVLNDETKKNSYGFSIPNKGIDLKRFKDNPVILDDHYNSTRSVIGRWTNIRVEGSQLKADTEFDMDDERAAVISGKVDRGFLKGASMGVSFNRDNMVKNPDGSYELTKCELHESSIVAIPSNASALRLYAESGELIPENEIKLSIEQIFNPKTEQMNKIILSLAALQALALVSTEDNLALAGAIEKMVAENATLKQTNQELEQKLSANLKTQAEALVDGAITEGKITADMKEEMVTMAMANFSSASKLIASMTAKKNLSTTVNNPAGNSEVKTAEDFQKLSNAEQLAFKNDNPEEYKKMFA